MAYLNELFDVNFLEYASYVVKERAIPYIEDGLKPVQRRILHSLFEMDDGKFNKVANVIGHCMKYHPHGDASIGSALVVLANKDLFIERQGNFGNIFTGDPASAPRYIECRLTPMAREVLYNPEITEFEPSYDGRNKEPLKFPAKIPVSIILGAEGIAVGMATKILPHNFVEVLDAMKKVYRGESFQLSPDFPTGGYVDDSKYGDGNGKVLSRAKIDILNKTTVVIREIPFGATTESLINSIDAASKKNKVMVTKINDFSTDRVEIELKLKRGFSPEEIVDALYAFTDCEKSITVNLLLIEENVPVQVTVSDVIVKSSEQLKWVLERELQLEKDKLDQKKHRRTLELIFVQERIYKDIEKEKTAQAVKDAVFGGLLPFRGELLFDVTDEDVEHLLRMPIRRISAYDIEKALRELEEMQARIDEILALLKDIVGYATSWIDGMLAKYGDRFPRKTEIVTMEQTSVKEAAIRDRKLIYNGNKGYLGYDLKEGPERCKVSVYDRILLLDRKGGYKVIEVPDKKFVGYRMRYIGLADEKTMNEVTFTALYRNGENVIYLKRFQINKFILDRDYSILPDDSCELLELYTETEGEIVVRLVPTPRSRKFEELCPLEKYTVKGVTARGYKITDREIESVEFKKPGAEESPLNSVDALPLFAEREEEPTEE